MEASDRRAYYQFYRDEIKREDGIIHNHLIVAITFQGLLTAAMGFLVSGAWTRVPEEIRYFRMDVIGGLGVIGLVVSTTSCIGVWAARFSIEATKNAYADAYDELDKERLCPQIHGTGLPFAMGNFYAKSLPLIFTALWSLYLIYFAFRTSLLSWNAALGLGVAYDLTLLICLLHLQWTATKEEAAQRKTKHEKPAARPARTGAFGWFR